MILIRKEIEPVLEDLNIKGYHIGGKNAISLVSKCGEPILVFYDFAVKSNFTTAERKYIIGKVTRAIEENINLIADIEDARTELKTIKIDKRVNNEYSNLRYIFQTDIILTLSDLGEFSINATRVGLNDLSRALASIDIAKSLLKAAQIQKNRMQELKLVIDQGKACSI